MDDDHKDKAPTIHVIKRIKKIKKGGHHGGSWKLAYADFVTAMMAFFLLMWLLSLLNHYQLEGIAEYFKKPFAEAFKFDKKSGQFDNSEPNTETEKEKEKQKPNKADKEDNKNVNSYYKNAPAMTELQKLKLMKENFEKKLASDPRVSQYKNQLDFIVTADGLKIRLRDLENKPMFSTGKADFTHYAQPLLTWLSEQLNQYPNQIEIIGHTDTAQYSDPKIYSNWELSTDRANATRRALLHNGLKLDKFARILGLGDHNLLDQKNGLNPSNRRIEIVVLTNEAMNRISKE